MKYSPLYTNISHRAVMFESAMFYCLTMLFSSESSVPEPPVQRFLSEEVQSGTDELEAYRKLMQKIGVTVPKK